MIRTFLLLALLFVALSAIPSGVMLALSPDGAAFQMPVTILAHTPFPNFLIPGLVLCLVVGGSALVAAVAVWIRHNNARFLALLAGVMQGGWIVVQMLLLGIIASLQFLYIAIGAVIIILALLWKNPKKMAAPTSKA